ncbi:hypothetical protein D6C83_01872 [Aureobasidium pullulans]|uniref:Uncharacterized protein n=1 Tax=Aureobasidium pullulans TaxID=5580 RepID=A0A4T0E1U1_AURPU|nr:hypothetical protein D6C83_01872 [Aureobasidium pullulans]
MFGNLQQSRKDSTTIWHRDADGSVRAEEYEDLLTYLRARRVYLYSNDSADSESADEMWKRWLKRDSHPAVDAFKQYNGSSPEILMLKDVMKGLRSGETALDKAQYDLSRAQRTLDLAIRLLTMNGTEHLLTETKDILKKLTRDLRSSQDNQHRSIEKLENLEIAVKSLVEAKSAAERLKKRKRRDDLKMADTVEFVKECMDKHCQLIDTIIGYADPLVQQGTDLMQSVLSEEFDRSVMSGSESESEAESASDAEPEEDPESESEEAYEDEYDRKLQERRNQAILAEHHPTVKRQTKLVLGRVEKSKRILTRSKRDRSVSADYEPESEVKHATPVRRNPKRKARSSRGYASPSRYMFRV